MAVGTRDEGISYTADKLVLVIVGPTASGKSEVALHVAERIPSEILSADSRQLYKHLNIGTAKPSPEVRARIPHHFIDCVELDEEFSAGRYGVEGRVVIDEVLRGNRLPMVVGGSGLYVRALVDGLFEGPGGDNSYRTLLDSKLASEGVESLFVMLQAVDPATAYRIDRNNARRIIRALEVHHATGIPISEQHRMQDAAVPFVPVFVGLRWERSRLYQRINTRCDEMISRGLLEEVRTVLSMGVSPSASPLNTVGYTEAIAHLNGEVSFDEMVRMIKQNTRRYAKRQMTWFRADDRIRWIDMDESKLSGGAAAEIIEHLQRP